MPGSNRRALARRHRRGAKLCAAAALFVAASRAGAGISIVQNSNTNWSISNGDLNVTFDPANNDLTNIAVGSGPNILDTRSSSHTELYPEFAGTPFGSGTQTYGYQIGPGGSYIDFYTSTAYNPTLNSSGAVTNPITYAFHYVLFNNDPDIAAYEVLNHTSTEVATSVGQGQFLARVNPSLFNNTYQYNVSVNNPGPQTSIENDGNTFDTVSSQPGRAVQDATTDLTGSGLTGNWGSNVYTKYNYSSYTQFLQGSTEFGSQYAISSLYTSADTMNGGPTKQMLQFTNDNIVTQEFLSGHYGDSNYSYVPPQGVNSTKLYGPYDFRVTPVGNETGAQLYQDAINTMPTLTADYANDNELISNGYVPDYARGSVQVSASNSAGWSSNVNNNTVVLSDPNKMFQESTSGYQYWSQIAPNGTTTLTNVVPGSYRLTMYELGQWGETRVDGVTVQNGQVTIPQNLKFTPENFGAAAPVWTIGTPDRSAHEFLNGTNTTPGNGVTLGGDLRQFYGNYNYWLEEQNLGTPGYVSYYATAVGSTPATNNTQAWIANQWGKFNPGIYDAADGTSDGYAKGLGPGGGAPAYVTAGGGPANYGGAPWQVNFTCTQAQLNQGQYVVLSVGLAANEGSLTVALNGNSETWHYGNSTSDPMIRSGDAGVYKFLAFQFPAGDLHAAGALDQFTFSVSQNDGDMYDALRMEITNASASPTTTGWNDYEYITGSNTQTAANNSLGLVATNTFAPQAPGLFWNNSGAGGDGLTWDTANQNWNTGAAPALYADGGPLAFTDNNNGNYNVTLNTNVSPGSILVNNSNGNYTISGSGGIGGNGSLTKIGTSALTLSTVNTYSGGTNVNGGMLIVGANGALPNGNVSVSSVAKLTLAPGTGTTNVTSLTIATGGTVDITNNPLAINFGSILNDPAATIRGYIQNGYNNGSWTGTGITSSSAAQNPGLYAVGYADGGNDTNTVAAGTQVIVEYTLAGDANLDGIVNFPDLLLVAQNYGKTGQDWSEGDFNYDGIVNFPDLLIVAQNYGKQLTIGQLAELPGSFAAQWQLAQAEIQNAQPVPEPGTIALLAIGAAGLLARRRNVRSIFP